MDSIKFLIECYFGDIRNPIISAIDKAYFDMQTHTLSGDKEKELFLKRKEITELLYSAVIALPNQQEFDKWHRWTADDIKKNYPKLTYGQIQKWINMTLKYVYTLKQAGIDEIDDYFNDENAKKFHAPIDSYVLHSLKMDDIAWSKISSYDKYLKIQSKISFEEEYDDWSEFARQAQLLSSGKEKKVDKGAYKRYL